jgi:hypothetical protein
LIATVLVKAPASTQQSQAERGARASKTTRSAPRRRSFIEQLGQALGVGLTTTGMVALAAQTLLSTGTGWQLLAALAMVLLVHGVTARSAWALAGSTLALAGAVWMVSQLELSVSMLLEQAWPLLPLIAGISLLRLPAKRGARNTP